MTRGAEAYVVHIALKVREPKEVWAISIIEELPPKVFEDLAWLLHSQEVEFLIEVDPRIVTVKKAPYRMVSLKLKTLKSQLQELLPTRFISPSLLPWGVSTLSVKKNGRLLGCTLITGNWICRK